jgi:hypothetical protein
MTARQFAGIGARFDGFGSEGGCRFGISPEYRLGECAV